MTLFLWSRLYDGGDAKVPYFRVGGRTIAKECGVSYKAARAYLTSMEQDGWLVRVGDASRGQTQAYTFAWLAEDTKCAPTGAHPAPQLPAKRAHQCAPEQGKKGAQQSIRDTESATNVPPLVAADVAAYGEDPWETTDEEVEAYYANRPSIDDLKARMPAWMRG